MAKLTWVFILLNCLIFYIQAISFNKGFYISNELKSSLFFSEKFSLIRAITGMFTHKNFSHLFFNMIYFWFFFGEVEKKVRKCINSQVLSFFLIASGIFALLCHSSWVYLFDYMNHTNYINRSSLIGFSGVSFFAMGSWVALNRKNPMVKFILTYQIGVAVMQILDNGSSVATMAHVGGFALGLTIFSLIFKRN